jgi:hypothetical protein
MLDDWKAMCHGSITAKNFGKLKAILQAQMDCLFETTVP